MTGWKKTLESTPANLTYTQACVALTRIAAASPEHAEAVRDVMETLAKYAALGSGIKGCAHPRNAENMAFNVGIYAAKAEELNPPLGDVEHDAQ